jgi:hypothetical protein
MLGNSMATASYVIINTTGTKVFLIDADNNTVAIDNNKIVTLTDAGYQTALKIFGNNNVVLIPGISNGILPPYAYTPLGLATLTVDANTAQPLAPPAGATIVQISISGNDVNYRDDGTNPTSSVGIPASAGNEFFLIRTNLANVLFIAQTGTSTLTLSYYK